MKILLILDETSFFHPLFAHQLITGFKKNNFTVLGGLVTKIERKNNIQTYIIRNFYKLYLSEIFLLSTKKLFFKILSIIFPTGFYNNFFSVKSVFKRNKINFFQIEKNINTVEYINKIKDFKIDIIISSNSLYFGKQILELPRLGSINRHTSLLPSYGGLWPVLQAISHGEKETGVTIHKMTKDIDLGEILAQKKIPLENSKNLSNIYKKAFLCSPILIFEAVENLIKNKTLTNNNILKKSYFTFPSKNEWKNFRTNGGRFI